MRQAVVFALVAVAALWGCAMHEPSEESEQSIITDGVDHCDSGHVKTDAGAGQDAGPGHDAGGGDAGCTRTQGYWKTHSEHGPAPFDDTWRELPDGSDTTFFLSGGTYYEAISTPSRGNAYTILARQYIGAQLNQLAGASIPAGTADAFAEATDIFSTYTPARIAALPSSSPLRARIIELAGILADYNEGDTGPGHCD